MSTRPRLDIGKRHVIGDLCVWLWQGIARDFIPRGRVAELAERRLKVDNRSVWEFVYAKGSSASDKTWWLASAIVPRWLGDEPRRSDMSGVTMMPLPLSLSLSLSLSL
jgi:hypothetical protein